MPVSKLISLLKAGVFSVLITLATSAQAEYYLVYPAPATTYTCVDCHAVKAVRISYPKYQHPRKHHYKSHHHKSKRHVVSARPRSKYSISVYGPTSTCIYTANTTTCMYLKPSCNTCCTGCFIERQNSRNFVEFNNQLDDSYSYISNDYYNNDHDWDRRTMDDVTADMNIDN